MRELSVRIRGQRDCDSRWKPKNIGIWSVPGSYGIVSFKHLDVAAVINVKVSRETYLELRGGFMMPFDDNGSALRDKTSLCHLRCFLPHGRPILIPPIRRSTLLPVNLAQMQGSSCRQRLRRELALLASPPLACHQIPSLEPMRRRKIALREPPGTITDRQWVAVSPW